MGMSVNVQPGVDGARQAMRRNDEFVATSLRKVATGARVAGPEDDRSSYVISNSLKGNIAGLNGIAIQSGLATATTLTALKATEAIGDLLIEMKAKVVQANIGGLGINEKTALRDDIFAIRTAIDSWIIDGASFNGVNLLRPANQGDTPLQLTARTTTRLTIDYQANGTTDVIINTDNTTDYRLDPQTGLAAGGVQSSTRQTTDTQIDHALDGDFDVNTNISSSTSTTVDVTNQTSNGNGTQNFDVAGNPAPDVRVQFNTSSNLDQSSVGGTDPTSATIDGQSDSRVRIDFFGTGVNDVDMDQTLNQTLTGLLTASGAGEVATGSGGSVIAGTTLDFDADRDGSSETTLNLSANHTINLTGFASLTSGSQATTTTTTQNVDGNGDAITDAIVGYSVTTTYTYSGFGPRTVLNRLDSISTLTELGGTSYTVQNHNVTLESLGLSQMDPLNDPAGALTIINNAIVYCSSKAASLGSALRRLDSISSYAGHQSDIYRQGLGVLVDADLGKEAANLAAGRVKAQLVQNSLKGALTSSRAVLGFFK